MWGRWGGGRHEPRPLDFLKKRILKEDIYRVLIATIKIDFTLQQSEEADHSGRTI
jgi:hypothetical protein